MLGGIDPIIIFSFPLKPKIPTLTAVPGLPTVVDTFLQESGLPIPIYLSKSLGIQIESENTAIDIDTEPKAKEDGGTPEVSQRGLNSVVTINFFVEKNSIILTVLLGLVDMAFSKLVSREYSVTYLNGPIVIFSGLLHGFTANQGSDDTLMRLSLQISKANQKTTEPDDTRFYLPRVTGATPILGGS